jgi:pimeloyl-ACP methyl ester carboxylesterase
MDDDDVIDAMDEGMRAGAMPIGVLQAGVHDGVVELLSPAGVTLGMVRGEPGWATGVLMIGGAVGGFGGPAGTVYHDLADRLEEQGIASLRVHGREPGDLQACVQDLLTMRQWWRADGVQRVVAIGHSMGGATAIAAAGLDPGIVGVAGLAAQTAGTEMAAQLAPRPLLLIHGREDRIVPAFCSENIAERAGEPCELVLLDGCGHIMAQAAAEVVDRLAAWATRTLQGA